MHESEVSQSYPTLRDPMDCSPPGSSVHGIFQARTLEWGATALGSLQTLTANFLLLPFTSPWQPTLYVLSIQIWLLQVLHIRGIKQYLSFCNWHFIYHNAFKIHPCLARARISFLLKDKYYSITHRYTTFCLSIHLLIDIGHLGCFLLVVIVNVVLKYGRKQSAKWPCSPDEASVNSTEVHRAFWAGM